MARPAHRRGEAARAKELEAILVENARLASVLEERTKETSALLEISRRAASVLEFGPLLDLILDQLGSVVEFSRASVSTIEGNDFVVRAWRGAPGTQPPAGRVPSESLTSKGTLFTLQQPLLIPDIHNEDVQAIGYREGARALGLDITKIGGYIAVPLIARDRLVGLLALNHPEPDHFQQRHLEIVQAFAGQVAVAIENSRLYEQSRQLAVIEERQRIARDLHDSVSQTLYSILLSAGAARTLLTQDLERLAEPLDSMVELAEGGLAEMRALIFELRPESLELEGLVAAIEKDAAALRARHAIEVSFSPCDEPDIPLEVKEALSRTAQEAMHNIGKHAEATVASVNLKEVEGALVLEISDNGRGFDTGADYPGHLGLVSMRERVAKIGGELVVESQRGVGTSITVTLPHK